MFVRCLRESLSAALIAAVIVAVESEPCIADNSQIAKQKFEEGVKAIEKEDYPGALAAFEESYSLVPKASVLFNIGMCQKALYKYVESISSFKKYLKEVGENAEVSKALNEMERLVGKLVVLDSPNGAEVFVDDRQMGVVPLGGPLLVNPGQHALRVSKDGFQAFRQEVKVNSGGETSVKVELVPIGTRINVKCEGEKALVSLNGSEVGGCPYEGEVQPGKVLVEVEAPGMKPFSETVEAKIDETAIVEVSLEQEAAGPVVVVPSKVKEPEKAQVEPMPNVSEEKVSGLFITGLVFVVHGLAAGVLGGIYTYKYGQDFKDGEKAVDRFNAQPNQDDIDAYKDIRDKKLPVDISMMIVGYAAGGAALIAGTVMMIAGAGKGQEKLDVSAAPGGIVVQF